MLFVTGATGRMGGAVLRHVPGPHRAGSRSADAAEGASETVRFDLADAATFAPVLAGCDALFLILPPGQARRGPFDALMAEARRAGVGHVVCASVWGAQDARFLPHRHMEAAVRESGLPHTFLRPADFMQNLTDIHAEAIRGGELALPAGAGRSAFLDVEDVGRAAAAVLADRRRHAAYTYDLTGPEALTFGEVAETLSAVLDRPVRYRPVSVPRFVWSQVRGGRPLPLALVMSALYTMQRRGGAAPVSGDFVRLTGERPGNLRAYVERERQRLA